MASAPPAPLFLLGPRQDSVAVLVDLEKVLSGGAGDDDGGEEVLLEVEIWDEPIAAGHTVPTFPEFSSSSFLQS